MSTPQKEQKEVKEEVVVELDTIILSKDTKTRIKKIQEEGKVLEKKFVEDIGKVNDKLNVVLVTVLETLNKQTKTYTLNEELDLIEKLPDEDVSK